jgi:DNA polymerase I-like protein with 3'-5' exonuclease and polymerase domains
MRILLFDYADSALTSETLSICEDVLTEYSFSHDDVDYAHATAKGQLAELPKADVIVAMGAEAVRILLPSAPPLKKCAGALTYHPELKTWVLPTHTPNVIYTPEGRGYGQFDIFYDHLRRAIDLCQGTLQFPPVGGREMDWEFVGHNGTQGYNGDPKVWSGYFECTDAEESRQLELLEVWLTDLDSGEEIAFGLDTESYTIDYYKPLTMIQVYDPRWDKGFAFNWGVIKRARELWQRLLRHPRATWILHNAKHDRKMVQYWLDVDLGDRDRDTMALALGLTEKGNQTGLKYLSRQYCNAPYYEEGLEEWLDSDKDKINYGHIRPDVLAQYGCYDVFFTHQLSEVLPPLVEREGTAWLVENIILPAQRALSEVEYAGILIDQEYMVQLKEEWTPLIEDAIKEVQDYAHRAGFPYDKGVVKNQILRRICDCVPYSLHEGLIQVAGDTLAWASIRKYLREDQGINPQCNRCKNRRYTREIDETLNVASPNQMQHLCFDVLGMDETYEGRKTNKYFWKLNPSHPFTQLVEAYRQLDYLNRNIISGFAKHIREDGRIHPSFWLSGTVTGRLSASEPAVHGIPKHGDNPKRVRKGFKPDPGCVLVDCDYANLELYMAHHLTGDDALLEGLQKDLHRTTAAAMYMKNYEEVTDAERQSAKPVNFGAGYNIGPGKLSRDINLIKITDGKKSKAQAFLNAFWANYYVWNTARLGWVAEAMENCELRTQLGRVRRWNLITRDNMWKVENQACNFKGQSLASDLCLTSVVRLQKELTERGWGRVALTVHDSIVFSVKKEYVHEAVPLIKKIMTTPIFETKTPFRVDVQVGHNYGDTTAYDADIDYITW